MPPINETQASVLQRPQKNSPLNSREARFAVAVEHHRKVIEAKKWAVKSRRKASVKTVNRKGKKQRKRRKVMATTRKPNIQSTERDQKQTVIAAMNSFYFQVLCLNVFQFQLNRNVFYTYEDEFFVRNLESSVDKA